MFKSQVSCWSEGRARVFESRRGAASSDLANQSRHCTSIFGRIFQNLGDFTMGFAEFSPNSEEKNSPAEALHGRGKTVFSFLFRKDGRRRMGVGNTIVDVRTVLYQAKES